MNINNIALVRVTDAIPFDGIVRPISEVPYLNKERGSAFSYAMFNLLRSKGILKNVDWSKPDEVEKINKENDRIFKEYMPYNSEYNSMVLWSLNGLVPDDINNKFSDKTCVIIDGLAEQIESSSVISLVPTDTAIVGNVKLSENATILISQDRYEELSQEEKEKLGKLNLNINIFNGDLKENVDNELLKSGRYTAETLSLRREDYGYINSDTSDEVRETIENIAEEKELAQVLHFNILTGQNDEKDKLKSVKDEFENGLKVNEFYKRTFLEYLFSEMDIDSRVKSDARYLPESDVYMEALCAEIDKLGIDKYKEVVSKYNTLLEELRENGKLPTPQAIVNSIKENKRIDLLSMVKEQDKQDKLFDGAIKETEVVTRESVIEEQIKNVEQLEKEVTKEDVCKGAEI